MKTLLLLRHAKSSWDDDELDDFDRSLSPRGERDAPAMGAAMREHGWLPDRALISPAARTVETWKLVRARLGAATEASFPQKLYLAGADTILEQVRKVPAATEMLLVIGHNPGLEEFARALAGPGSDAGALAGLDVKYPTGALARFVFQGHWSGLMPGHATLTHFLKPREI